LTFVTPEQVLAAFSDPLKKRAWLVGAGKAGDQYQLDFRLGVAEKKMSTSAHKRRTRHRANAGSFRYFTFSAFKTSSMVPSP
jgi:hypothetical protein